MTAVVRWISKNHESVPPRDTRKTSEEPVGSTQFILRKYPNYCPNVGYCYLKWPYTFPGTNVCVIGLMEEWKKQLKETSKPTMNSAEVLNWCLDIIKKKTLLYGMDKIALL